MMQSWRAWLLATAATGVFAGAMIAIADLTPVYSLFMLLGTAALAAIIWSTDPRAVLLSLFLITLPVSISKALTSEALPYSPALSLFLSDLFFVPLLVLWMWDRLTGVPGVRWTSVHSVATLFIGWMTISAALSIVSVSWYVLLNIAKYFAYMIVLSDMAREPRRLRIALLAMGAGLSLQLLVVVLQVVTGSELNIPGQKQTDLGRILIFEQGGGMHFLRPTGLLPHPNVFADYLTFLLPILAVLAFAGRVVLGWIWWAVLVLLIGALAGLLLSLSRGGWIAFGSAMLFILAAGWLRGLVRGRDLGVLAVGVAITGAVLAAAFPAAVYRVTQSDQRSSESRIAMMDQALLIIQRNPIVGVGLAGYNKAAQTNIPSSFAGLLPAFRETLLKGVVHNKYLETFAESGVVGLVLLLALLGCLAVMPFVSSPDADAPCWLVLLGLSGAVVAQAVFYLFDQFSYDLRLGMLCATAGLMLGASDQLKRSRGRISESIHWQAARLSRTAD